MHYVLLSSTGNQIEAHDSEADARAALAHRSGRAGGRRGCRADRLRRRRDARRRPGVSPDICGDALSLPRMADAVRARSIGEPGVGKQSGRESARVLLSLGGRAAWVSPPCAVA